MLSAVGKPAQDTRVVQLSRDLIFFTKNIDQSWRHPRASWPRDPSPRSGWCCSEKCPTVETAAGAAEIIVKAGDWLPPFSSITIDSSGV